MTPRGHIVPIAIWSAGLFAAVTADTVHAQQTVRLTPCDVQGAVLKLAHQTVMSVGLETTCSDQRAVPAIVPSDFEEPAPDVPTTLNRIVAAAPEYKWRDMHGLIVVRPIAAWNDTGHFLTRPVKPFVATGDLSEAMAALSEPIQPMLFHVGIDHVTVQTDVDRDRLVLGARRKPEKPPYVASFPGGSLLEALNTLVRGKGAGAWVVSYCAPQPSIETAVVTVTVFDEHNGHTANVGLWHENRHVNPCMQPSP